MQARRCAPLPTDEPVRKGMLAIRDLVRINHSLVTHRRMPPDHAARFARQVKVEADGILATSNISGDAREKLHALLDEIVAGIDAVAKPEAGVSPIDGLVRADEALARYPRNSITPAGRRCSRSTRAGVSRRPGACPSSMDTLQASLYRRGIANCGTFPRAGD